MERTIRIRTIDDMVKNALSCQHNCYTEEALRKMLAKRWSKLVGKTFTAKTNANGEWLIPEIPAYRNVPCKDLFSHVAWDVI